MNMTQRDFFLLDRTLSNVTDFFKKRVAQKKRQIQKWDRWVMRLVVVTYIAIHIAKSFGAIAFSDQYGTFTLSLFILSIGAVHWYYGRQLDRCDCLLKEQPTLRELYKLARLWVEKAPDHECSYVLELCDALEKQDFEKSAEMIGALELFSPELANTQPIKFILAATRF